MRPVSQEPERCHWSGDMSLRFLDSRSKERKKMGLLLFWPTGGSVYSGGGLESDAGLSGSFLIRGGGRSTSKGFFRTCRVVHG